MRFIETYDMYCMYVFADNRQFCLCIASEAIFILLFHMFMYSTSAGYHMKYEQMTSAVIGDSNAIWRQQIAPAIIDTYRGSPHTHISTVVNTIGDYWICWCLRGICIIIIIVCCDIVRCVPPGNSDWIAIIGGTTTTWLEIYRISEMWCFKSRNCYEISIIFSIWSEINSSEGHGAVPWIFF